MCKRFVTLRSDKVKEKIGAQIKDKIYQKVIAKIEDEIIENTSIKELIMMEMCMGHDREWHSQVF